MTNKRSQYRAYRWRQSIPLPTHRNFANRFAWGHYRKYFIGD